MFLYVCPFPLVQLFLSLFLSFSLGWAGVGLQDSAATKQGPVSFTRRTETCQEHTEEQCPYKPEVPQ